jgi:hypothetical protein
MNLIFNNLIFNEMKNIKYILSLVSLLTIGLQNAFPFKQAGDIPSVYYVGGENASDANPGTKDAPFATISAAAAILTAGDTCYIRAGIYRETVVPANSGSPGNPIVFTGYGDGDVIISGADKADGDWTVYEGKIYQKTISLPVTGYRDAITGNETLLANQVFVDGKMMIEARWPNVSNSDDLMNRDDYRMVQNGWTSENPNTIFDNSIPDIPGGWTGGTIWAIIWYKPNTFPITASSTGQISWDGKFHPRMDLPRNFYYLTGRLGALDVRKEWFYDGTKLYLWAPDGGVPKNVEVKTRNYAFDLRGKSYITISNIKVFAATITTDSGSESITLDGLRIQYNSHFVTLPGSLNSHSNESGIRLMGSNSVIQNSIIEYSAGHGIVLGGDECVAENNLIHDISYGGTYCCGIYPAPGNARNTITHNTIFRTGRSGIDRIYANKEIAYNDIYEFGLLNTDLGAIYSANQTDLTGTRIHHNWLHDAGNDEYHSFSVGAGIYLDQDTRPATIHHNVFWNNHENDIRTEQNALPGNKVYNNTLTSNEVCYTTQQGGYDPANNQNNIFRSPGNKTHIPQASEITSETDPLFLGEGEGGLAYQLKAGSPAIDHGIVIKGITGDYQGSAPDAGAYEYGRPAWKAGVTNYYDIQLEFINSSSGKPMEGLEVIFRGKQYTTNSQGNLPLFKLLPAEYKITLPDTTWQLVGNNILEVFSDSVFRINVKELLSFSVRLEFLDSSSGNPLEGLELSIAGSTHVTDSQGVILIPDLLEGNHTLALADNSFQITGNPVIKLRSDTVISFLVTKIHWLTFQVIDRSSGSPVYRATVTVNGAPYYSSSSGLIEVGEYPSGPFYVSVSHNDYFPLSDTLIFSGDTTMILSLTPKLASVTFQVSDATGPLGNARVIMTGSQYTNSSGHALFFNQPARKDYTYSVEKDGYLTVQDTFYLEIDTTLEVMLEKATLVQPQDFPAILISPNPFDSHIHITLQEEAQLKLYDISGVNRLTMKLEEGLNTIQTGNLAEGFYMVRISGNERVFNKVMVNKGG